MNADTPPLIPKRRRVALGQARSTSMWEIGFRLLTVFAIIAALAVALWSLFGVWFPIQKESQEQTSRLARMSDEVDQLDRKWPKAEIERVRTTYDRVRPRLFSSEAGLDDWLDYLKAESTSLNLGLKVDFGKPIIPSGGRQELKLIPAKISVDINPAPGGEESPYQRLLRLTQEIAAQGKRADLTEMNVEGGSSSVSHAVLSFELWASEEGEQ